MKRPPWERFWEKVDRSGGPEACWEWQGHISHDGYGRFPMEDPKTTLAHHAACRFAGIDVPGYPKSQNVIDHICKTKSCVNPRHLRVVPQAENCMALARPTPFWRNKQKTHCIYGHPLSGDNLAVVPAKARRTKKPTTTRVCLTCYPSRWMYCVTPREGPPMARYKWVGPATVDECHVAGTKCETCNGLGELPPLTEDPEDSRDPPPCPECHSECKDV